MLELERVSETSDDLRLLIGELDAELGANYTADQQHGLRLEALFAPNIRFFIIRSQGDAVGCGGVALYDGYAELKRMYVRPQARRSGVADMLVAKLEGEARGAGYRVVRLETGDKQDAAIRLYERHGYAPCAMFGEYSQLAGDAVATSVFMEKTLA